MNGDGKPDLATVDPDAASATVMLGAGDGKFQFLNSYETDGTSPLFGILGDLNGDGKTDLAIANACQVNFQDSCTGAVIALLGDGHGIFAGPVGYDGGGLPSALATVDLNQDGTPDLSVAIQCGSRTDCSTSGVSVLLGKPDGTFQPPVSYGSGGNSPASVAAGDFNGDGRLDLLVVNSCVTQLDCSHGIIGVLFGNGDGTFHAPVTYPSGGVSPKSVGIGDFNGDGKLDLGVVQCADLVTCSSGSNGSVSVLRETGMGASLQL